MRKVLYHPKVPGEVRDFLEHNDSISGELGDSFWQELTEAIEYARGYPERHHFRILDPAGKWFGTFSPD
jgi:hypothetical protein